MGDPKGRDRNKPCPKHPSVKAKRCTECLKSDWQREEEARQREEAADPEKYARLAVLSRPPRIDSTAAMHLAASLKII